VEVESVAEAVFDIIYERYSESVYRTARKYSGNHHNAEEIFQNVFLKLYLHIDHVDVDAAGKWLTLTAKNMALNYKRDHAREYLVEELCYEEENNFVDSEDDPENLFFRKLRDNQCKELTEDIFEALYRKNPRWYDAVTITYVLERPQKEVADVMGISLEVLHSMLYRAKKWIRKNYEEKYDHLDRA
jgi:RNA polymerase sigma-70 factor (ECF subfamily)